MKFNNKTNKKRGIIAKLSEDAKIIVFSFSFIIGNVYRT